MSWASSSGTQKFLTAASSAVPIQMEKNTTPIMPIQKSHALSQELTHSNRFIASPSSSGLQPGGSLGSGYTCSTHCSMLRLLPDSVDKVYTLLTSRVAVVLLDGFVGGVTHNE